MELSTKTLESDILKFEFSPSDGDTDLSDGIKSKIRGEFENVH